MVGFNSNLNNSKREHPSFDGWSEEEVEKYFSDLDDAEIAVIVRERLYGEAPVSEVSVEELAAAFGIDLNALGSVEEIKPSRPAGFRLN